MEIQDILALVQAVADNGLTELKVDDGNVKLSLKKEHPVVNVVAGNTGAGSAGAGMQVAGVQMPDFGSFGAAGALAAEKTYEVLKDRIANADGKVRIGVMGQDATSESIVNRGLGFIDKMGELIIADGKTVSLEGNDRYVGDAKVEATDDGDVVIEILVPSQVTSELSAIDCQTLLNKDDTICVYGSNQHSAEAMITGNENLQKLGSGDDQVIGVGFDSGANIKAAVADGTFIGAITQAPVAMGASVVELACKAAKGETVEDVDSGCQWYTAENMNDEEIAQNLYD